MLEVVTFRSKLGHFIKNINLRAYVNPPSEFTSHTAAKASVINLSHFSTACVWQGNWEINIWVILVLQSFFVVQCLSYFVISFCGRLSNFESLLVKSHRSIFSRRILKKEPFTVTHSSPCHAQMVLLEFIEKEVME